MRKIETYQKKSPSLAEWIPRGQGRPPGYARQALSSVIIICAFFWISIFPSAGFSASPGKIDSPGTFDAYVRFALANSPHFMRSSIEVDIHRIDEKDALYSFIPSLILSTRYYINTSFDEDSGKGFDIIFSTGPYDPLRSYFSLKARKLLTRMAVLNHLEVISRGIRDIGQKFIILQSLSELADLQEKILGLLENKQKYVNALEKINASAKLEAELMKQQIQMAELELGRARLTKKKTLRELKSFVGVDDDQALQISVIEAPSQVLGAVKPGAGGFSLFLTQSHQVKMLDLRKKLQEMNLLMAYAKFVPTLRLGLRNPDTLGIYKSQELYVSVGVDIPIFKGGQRLRNIGRQKLRLKQFEIEAGLKRNALKAQWLTVTEEIDDTDASYKTAALNERLTLLKENLARVRYYSGDLKFSDLVDSQINQIKARMEKLAEYRDFNLARLNKIYLSGDLLQRFVNNSNVRE